MVCCNDYSNSIPTRSMFWVCCVMARHAEVTGHSFEGLVESIVKSLI